MSKVSNDGKGLFDVVLRDFVNTQIPEILIQIESRESIVLSYNIAMVTYYCKIKTMSSIISHKVSYVLCTVIPFLSLYFKTIISLVCNPGISSFVGSCLVHVGLLCRRLPPLPIVARFRVETGALSLGAC